MSFDLFVDLDASDEQLDFPIIYGAAREGMAKYEMDDDSTDLVPLFETIIKTIFLGLHLSLTTRFLFLKINLLFVLFECVSIKIFVPLPNLKKQ